MPVKIFGKTYKGHDTAAAAAKRKGIKDPHAYVATVERAQKGKGGGKTKTKSKPKKIKASKKKK